MLYLCQVCFLLLIATAPCFCGTWINVEDYLTNFSSVFLDPGVKELAKKSGYGANGRNGLILIGLPGLSDHPEFQVKASVKSAHGATIQRLQQIYKRMEVKGSSLIIRYLQNSRTEVVLHGKVATGLRNLHGHESNLSLDTIKTIVSKHENVDPSNVAITSSKDTISVTKQYDSIVVETEATLTHVGTSTNIKYFIDKYTQEILETDKQGHIKGEDRIERYSLQEKLQALNKRLNSHRNAPSKSTMSKKLGQPCEKRAFGIGGNTRSGPILYGRWPFCLDVEISSDGKICTLRNNFAEGVDLKHSGSRKPYLEPVSYKCHQGVKDPTNGGASPILDGFFYGTEAMRMMKEWYSYTKLQNPPVSIRVHYLKNHKNAHAANDRIVLFGDGGGNGSFPYTNSPDVVGHELAHLIIQEGSNLKYENISGALDEGFADFFGESFEYYLLGEADWMAGRWKALKGRGIRDYIHPSSKGHVEHIDNYGVWIKKHQTSGIFNKVFSHMASLIGIRGTGETLLIANTVYWTRYINDFQTIACDVIRATYDSGHNMFDTAAAFASVGISVKGSCPDFSKFVTAELGEEPIPDLKVSYVRQPLFKTVIRRCFRGVVIKVNSPKVEILVSLDVAGKEPVAKEQRFLWKIFLTCSVLPFQGTYYVRLVTDSTVELEGISLTRIDLEYRASGTDDD